MNGSTQKKKVKECIFELNKLSSIKFGQKWSVTNMEPVSSTFSNRALRTLLTNDSQEVTKTYIDTVYQNAFMILESIISGSANYLRASEFIKTKSFKQVNALITNIPAADTGINNLKGAYPDDNQFHDWVDRKLKLNRKKLNSIHYMLCEYLRKDNLLSNNTMKEKPNDNQPVAPVVPVQVLPDNPVVPTPVSPDNPPVAQLPIDHKVFNNKNDSDDSSDEKNIDIKEFTSRIEQNSGVSDSEIF